MPHGPLRLQDLEPYTLLLREQGSGTRLACEEYFKEKRVHFTQTLEVASRKLSASVGGRLGVALLTRHALNLELATGTLKELPVEECTAVPQLVRVQAKSQAPVTGAACVPGVYPQRYGLQSAGWLSVSTGKLLALPASN